jgi:hypothetical protein
MESHHWPHRTKEWHAGCSEQVFHHSVKRLNGRRLQRDICPPNGSIAMHTPLGCQCCFSCAYPTTGELRLSSMRKASLSATANKPDEFSLFSEIKLRFNMTLLVKVEYQRATCNWPRKYVAGWVRVSVDVAAPISSSKQCGQLKGK